ncbi:pyocin activator PrtN family protein [Xanthomonas vasicola]|nr:pyocin activator PrtN family protein [Xanthomonas vasicola]MDO6934543.1 pyocin activator PrtN family protein [Xanthomonas vasicola]
MSVEQFRAEFMPKLTMKTLQNWIARGDAPKPINGVVDVRDVATWWDGQRKQKTG